MVGGRVRLGQSEHAERRVVAQADPGLLSALGPHLAVAAPPRDPGQELPRPRGVGILVPLHLDHRVGTVELAPRDEDLEQQVPQRHVLERQQLEAAGGGLVGLPVPPEVVQRPRQQLPSVLVVGMGLGELAHQLERAGRVAAVVARLADVPLEPTEGQAHPGAPSGSV